MHMTLVLFWQQTSLIQCKGHLNYLILRMPFKHSCSSLKVLLKQILLTHF